MTSANYEQAITEVESKLDDYNQPLSSVDEKANDPASAEKALSDLSGRFLAGVAARLGKDGNEYEKGAACARVSASAAFRASRRRRRPPFKTPRVARGGQTPESRPSRATRSPPPLHSQTIPPEVDGKVPPAPLPAPGLASACGGDPAPKSVLDEAPPAV